MTLCFTLSALRTAQNVGAWRIDFDSMIYPVRSIHSTLYRASKNEYHSLSAWHASPRKQKVKRKNRNRKN